MTWAWASLTRVSDSGRVQEIELEFGRIRRTNSNPRLRITLGPSGRVNRIWREFGTNSNSGVRPDSLTLTPADLPPHLGELFEVRLCPRALNQESRSVYVNFKACQATPLMKWHNGVLFFVLI